MSTLPTEASYSEPAYTQVADRNKYPFYVPNIDKKLVPETQELLETYSNIPRGEQSEHIHRIRDKAFEIRAYPCIGLGAFVVPQLCRLLKYPTILERVKNGGILMDVGCFVGHDLRRLAYDGAPSQNLYGIDIVDYWNIGYEMFRDQHKFRAHFIEADMLSDSDSKLAALKERVDIISALQIIHQWEWANQVRACKSLVKFSMPGTLFVGNQIGHAEGKAIIVKQANLKAWWHNPDTFAKMMDQVGNETGTKWETEARMVTFVDMGWDESDAAWMPSGAQVIEFCSRRVE